jgi:hypothetical protein
MQYTILLGGPTICNMRYYWAGPLYPYAIYDIIGRAHHMQYAILLGGPILPICNIRYYWVGPPYAICDIIGSARPAHMQYAILLGGPAICNMQYYWVGLSCPYVMCSIIGQGHMQCGCCAHVLTLFIATSISLSTITDKFQYNKKR